MVSRSSRIIRYAAWGWRAVFVKPAVLAVDQSTEISPAGIGALLCILMW